MLASRAGIFYLTEEAVGAQAHARVHGHTQVSSAPHRAECDLLVPQYVCGTGAQPPVQCRIQKMLLLYVVLVCSVRDAVPTAAQLLHRRWGGGGACESSSACAATLGVLVPCAGGLLPATDQCQDGDIFKMQVFARMSGLFQHLRMWGSVGYMGHEAEWACEVARRFMKAHLRRRQWASCAAAGPPPPRCSTPQAWPPAPSPAGSQNPEVPRRHKTVPLCQRSSGGASPRSEGNALSDPQQTS